MNQTTQVCTDENEIVDFTTFAGILCHLMTLYALRPCEPLAANIHHHFKVLLNSSASDPLGEWVGTFHQLLVTWESIAEQHQRDNQQINIESQPVISH
jgi:hypothetical protein